MNQKTLRVWHFFRDDGRTGEGLLRVKVWETMHVKGEIIPCRNGLHGSVRAIDAMRYAPGVMVQIADLSGTIIPHGTPVDKHAASARTCIAIANAEPTLRYFARWCALSVTDKWDPPQVVIDFLMTGNPELRAAARAAAWAAQNEKLEQLLNEAIEAQR